MRLLDFGDAELAEKLLKQIVAMADALGPIKIMEVCGTHTMEIGKLGLRSLLPETLELLSGPGCPVCVTPGAVIDAAAQCAGLPNVTVMSFGDMIRVPGHTTSLRSAREAGGRVEIAASPLQTVKEAAAHSDQAFVFVAVGFETTVPVVARAVLMAKEQALENISFLVAHRLVPPALQLLVDDPDLPLSGVLAPGHASAILGKGAYDCLEAAKIPTAITGFAPLDILAGLHSVLRMLTEGRHAVENMYPRMVRDEGNPAAMALIHQVFEAVDAEWRGIGVIPQSGLKLRAAFADFDAATRYGLKLDAKDEIGLGCKCGHVLRGHITPNQCPLFGKVCTPEAPRGPCMVSSEGSCSAYYKYH